MNPAYSLKNVQCSYGSTPALSVDNLCIEAGTITTVIGPNGAGKSTLLNLLAFLITGDTGELEFFSQNIRQINVIELRRRVGLVSQNPYLLKGTVLDNIELGLKFRAIPFSRRRNLAMAALGRLGMERFALLAVNSLSGGEIQKVALARVLVLEPEVVLFDEPFTYLDPAGVVQIEKIMQWLSKDLLRTVIFSTHERLDGMALADRVVSIVAGKIVDTPVINLYSGWVKDGYFNTGRIKVLLAGHEEQGKHIAIDPNEIVLSNEPLKSSMRNNYQGSVTAISAGSDGVRVTVEASERFYALITRQALEELRLNLYTKVWVNFKSTSAKLLES